MATGAPITYQVTRVTPDTQYPPGEQPVPGKSVAFSTSVGYSGTVFVPDSVFADASAVRKLIEGEVKLVAAAQAIVGTV
jgi:hypothetical protein